MLITTSRKPSRRTRSFCQNLGQVLQSMYISRGKMSIWDILRKAGEFEFEKIAIISEIKGNPSRMTIYNRGGERLLSLDITVAFSESKGRIKKDDLSIRCQVDDLRELVEILNIPQNAGKSNSNIIWIKKGERDKKAVIEFYDDAGIQISPKIYVKDWRH